MNFAISHPQLFAILHTLVKAIRDITHQQVLWITPILSSRYYTPGFAISHTNLRDITHRFPSLSPISRLHSITYTYAIFWKHIKHI